MNIVIINSKNEDILRLHLDKSVNFKIDLSTLGNNVIIKNAVMDLFGELLYEIKLIEPENSLEQISTDDLLKEIKKRIIIK